jgi:SAM-dependent methyltransferase
VLAKRITALQTILTKMFYVARNIRSRRLFDSLRSYCRGSVLDVGGWDFFRTALAQGVSFTSWTVLETAEQKVTDFGDDRIRIEIGDGCSMHFKDASFDTVLNVQVLEHVFEPNAMMREMCRVLKPGGHLIILVPQTATLHLIPHHYYNFTRFWIKEDLIRNGMEQLELRPLGGIWSSMASHLVYFVFQSLRVGSMSAPEFRRPWLFYPLYPFMLLFAFIAFPICLFLSLGDLTEEPNNHLVVARKPAAQEITQDDK